MTVSSAESMNGSTLSTEEKREIDSTFAYSLKRAMSVVLNKFADTIEKPSDDTSQQVSIGNELLQSSLQLLEKYAALNAQVKGVLFKQHHF